MRRANYESSRYPGCVRQHDSPRAPRVRYCFHWVCLSMTILGKGGKQRQCPLSAIRSKLSKVEDEDEFEGRLVAAQSGVLGRSAWSYKLQLWEIGLVIASVASKQRIPVGQGMRSDQKVGEHPLFWLPASLAVANISLAGSIQVFPIKGHQFDLH